MNPYFQTLGERFLKAGWASKIIDKPDEFSLHYTPEGEKSMKQLYDLISKLGVDAITVEELAIFRGLIFQEGARRGWDRPA